MSKRPGFTLIELLTVIAILGILFVISIPEFRNLRETNTFRSQNQALWDQISTARSNALTNRKCDVSTVATGWQIEIGGIDNGSPLSHSLNCLTGPDFINDVNTVSGPTTLTNTEIDALEVTTSTGTTTSYDAVSITTSNLDKLRISFLGGSAQARIELDDTSGPPAERLDDFRIVFGHTYENSDKQQTVCMNRVASFPTINKYGNICSEDV